MNEYQDHPNGAYFIEKYGTTKVQEDQIDSMIEDSFQKWFANQENQSNRDELYKAYLAGSKDLILREVNY